LNTEQPGRIRTIRAAAEFFKAQDPETCLTETTIRTLVRSGKVASTKIGNRHLISIEALEAYLQGQTEAPVPLPKQKTRWHIA